MGSYSPETGRGLSSTATKSSDLVTSDTDDADSGVPDYLTEHYWWTYVHPKAVRFFERPWLVNLILWGKYVMLRDAAVGELGERLEGHTLQVACVYGDLTQRLAKRVPPGSTIDIVDVLPIQLENLRAKLPAGVPARFLKMDSSRLHLPDASYDRVLLFFLLHEMPPPVREATLLEALRVLRPGGKLVLVDFARPAAWHPLKYLWHPVLTRLEPFAPDLWTKPIETWLPEGHRIVSRTGYFGGFYQMVVIEA